MKTLLYWLLTAPIIIARKCQPNPISPLWAVFLLLLAWPVTGKADFFSYPFHYRTNNDGAILTWYLGKTNSLIIPSTIDGLPVRIIGVSAFFNGNTFTNVVIPDSVFSIENYAFRYCSYLESLTIGNNVTNLGNGALENCTSLTHVTLPAALVSIGAGAFENAQSLSEITVDEDNPVFSSLDGVLFNKPQTLLLLCPNGKTGALTIPDGTTAIKDAAFQNCARLTSVVIPDSVTNMGNSTFRNCTTLTSASVGTGVLNIGASAFCCCSNLVQITFSPHIVGLGDSAFQYCSSLTNFVMPNTVTNSGTRTFSDCTNLVSATVSTNLTTLGNFLFWNCYKLRTVIIPPGVVILGNGAFGNGIPITSLIIPDSVQTIGDFAFNVAAITYLQMGASVTNIGQGAFLGCNKITSTVTMPKTLLYIGNDGFSACWRVPGIFFQGDAPALGYAALSYNSGVTAYYLPGTLGWSNQLGGIPARLWNPWMQPISSGSEPENKTFAVNITGTTNIPIVVEASTNLDDSTWTKLFSGVVTNGTIDFTDPKSTNYSRRFYRIRSP